MPHINDIPQWIEGIDQYNSTDESCNVTINSLPKSNPFEKPLREYISGNRGHEIFDSKLIKEMLNYNPCPIPQTEKYYTPAIEDMHAGYECEEQIYPEYDKPFWKPLIIGNEYNPTDSFRERKTIKLPFPEFIRTPYLTKEQLIKDGWKYSASMLYGNVTDGDIEGMFEKGNIMCIVNYKLHKITLFIIDPSKRMDEAIIWGVQPEHFRFTCNCPSINEFRQICKLLNIK